MAELTPEQQTARQQLSGNLKRLRGRLELSQEALADLAGLHRTYVSQVERCVVNVSLDNIVLLATALGAQPVDLFQEPGEVLPVRPGRKPSKAKQRQKGTAEKGA